MDADEDNIIIGHHGQAVEQAPLLAEDIIDNDVVARLSHASHRAVEPRAQCE